MGVSVRQQERDGNWYIYIRHAGQRASQKCRSEQHALDTQKAVITAIAAGQFDIEAPKKTPEPKKEPQEPKEQKPSTPTVQEYYDKIFLRVWIECKALARSTAANYRKNFKTHILPA